MQTMTRMRSSKAQLLPSVSPPHDTAADLGPVMEGVKSGASERAGACCACCLGALPCLLLRRLLAAAARCFLLLPLLPGPVFQPA